MTHEWGKGYGEFGGKLEKFGMVHFLQKTALQILVF
jgi:hypothetical protein